METKQIILANDQEVENAGNVRDLFNRLIELNRETFAGRHYSAAYHALASACHLAQDAEDENDLIVVEKIADEQLAWINENAPEYEHSSFHADQRGHRSIWKMLSNQAKTSRLIVHRVSRDE